MADDRADVSKEEAKTKMVKVAGKGILRSTEGDSLDFTFQVLGGKIYPLHSRLIRPVTSGIR